MTQVLLPWQRMAELALKKECDRWAGPPDLLEAMRYAVLGAGKRLRPVLTLASAVAAGGRSEDALGAAVGLELMHAYSLVHDDMPCLDDDVERRGQPTVHVRWGEAMALLVGDALQTAAFEAVLSAEGPSDPERRLKALRVLANASGSRGMVGGQVLDIQVPEPTREALKTMHAAKTGALFVAAVDMASAVTGAPPEIADRLHRYGIAVGEAFQLSDDVLDLVEIHGNPDGHEADVNLAAILGMGLACDETRRLVSEAQEALSTMPGERGVLEAFARWIGERVASVATG